MVAKKYNKIYQKVKYSTPSEYFSFNKNEKLCLISLGEYDSFEFIIWKTGFKILNSSFNLMLFFIILSSVIFFSGIFNMIFIKVSYFSVGSFVFCSVINGLTLIKTRKTYKTAKQHERENFLIFIETIEKKEDKTRRIRKDKLNRVLNEH